MVVTSLLSVVVVIYLLSLVLETFLLSQMVANKVMSVVLVKYSLSVGRGLAGVIGHFSDLSFRHATPQT